MSKLALAILACSAFLGIANAQIKLAVINSQKAILETEEIKKAQLELTAKYKPRQDQLEKLLRNVLAACDIGNSHGFARTLRRQVENRLQRIFTFDGDVQQRVSQ